VAHFDIPLDLPHAGRLADRILNLLERHTEESGINAEEAMDTAERMSNLLFRFSANDENPSGEEAVAIRESAATLGRQLVDQLEIANVKGDRLGQYVRNFFECLELGAEGAAISLRAGENPDSMQRPV
jgi:hypothetical protein